MATIEGAVMNNRFAYLPRLLAHLLLLPFVLLWVPAMFALGWARAAIEDLRPARLRPAPAYRVVPASLPPVTRARPYR
jgi:hypothetical protein